MCCVARHSGRKSLARVASEREHKTALYCIIYAHTHLHTHTHTYTHTYLHTHVIKYRHCRKRHAHVAQLIETNDRELTTIDREQKTIDRDIHIYIYIYIDI